MKKILLAFFILGIGFAAGLAYSWLAAPVEYVDASPALLRADFKDQYRILIAASYAATRDLARANARLNLLGDLDPLGALRAQAQRMVGETESKENIELLVQLASDMEKGTVSVPITSTPQPTATEVTEIVTPEFTSEPFTQTPATELVQITATPTLEFIQTPFELPAFTLTPQPTSTPVPKNVQLILVGQEKVCDRNIQPGLMQFTVVDSRRRQMAGMKIVVTSIEGQDILFTGFKPEVGDGYADFAMKENVSYSVRIGEGGTFVTNLSAPACTDSNGIPYLGGLSLAFQQP